MKYVEIRLRKCSSIQGTTCLPEEDIKNYFAKEQLSVIYLSNRFEPDNQVDQIVSHIDDGLSMSLRAGTMKKASLLLSKSEATIEDSFIQLGQATERVFDTVRLGDRDDSDQIDDIVATVIL